MPREYDDQSRDRKILDAAAALFFEKGYSAVGIDDIGAVAGISGPAVYRHFRGKDEILATLFDEAIDGIVAVTAGQFSDGTEELTFRVRTHAEYVIRERKLASVWLREDRSLSDYHRRRLRRRELNYVDGFVDCVGRAFPALDDASARRATLMALGCLNALVLWPAAPLAAPDALDAIARFVLGGLQRAAREVTSTGGPVLERG